MNKPLTLLQVPKTQRSARRGFEARTAFDSRVSPVEQQPPHHRLTLPTGNSDGSKHKHDNSLDVTTPPSQLCKCCIDNPGTSTLINMFTQEREQPKCNNDIGNLPLGTLVARPPTFRTKVKNQTRTPRKLLPPVTRQQKHGCLLTPRY